MKLQSYVNRKLIYASLLLLPLFLIVFQLVTFRQDPRSRATGSVRLFVNPESSSSNPIRKNLNETVELKLMLDPAQASVSVVKVELIYNTTNLQLAETNGVQFNTNAFPSMIDGPVVRDGKVAFTVSIGADATKAITSQTEVATVRLKTLATTTSPLEIKYGDNSVVVSVGPSETLDDNVLGTKDSAYIEVGTNFPTGATTPIPPPIGGCPYDIPDASVPISLVNTGSQVWVTNYDNNTISRIALDGSKAGESLTENGLNGPTGIALIGNEVWVANYDNNTISFFNLDGTSAASPLTLPNNSDSPEQRGILGFAKTDNEVWLSDQKNNVIFRLKTDKQLAGDPIKIPGIVGMRFITTVGQEVWVVSNPTLNPSSADGKIYRLKFDGTSAGSPIVNSKLINPTHILAVGNEIWVTDELETNFVRFKQNGDFIGIIDMYELAYVNSGMAVVNGKVWIIEGFENLINILDSQGRNLCGNIEPTVSVRPTQNPDRTTLELKLLLHGIGKAGDNTNPTGNSFSNKNPVTQERTISIQLVNEDNEIIATKIAPAFYSKDQGLYFSNVIINDTIPTGDYVVKVKSDGYLRQLMPGFFSLQPGKKFAMPVTQLTAGDINGDNTLNVLDYNVLYDCGYGKINPKPMIDPGSAFKSPACQSHAQKELADLTDNGTVDNKDYNLFIREF